MYKNVSFTSISLCIIERICIISGKGIKPPSCHIKPLISCLSHMLIAAGETICFYFYFSLSILTSACISCQLYYMSVCIVPALLYCCHHLRIGFSHYCRISSLISFQFQLCILRIVRAAFHNFQFQFRFQFPFAQLQINRRISKIQF